ncbi:Phospholipase A1 [Psidium guajava]|nr:Phospholipase A1 [Psidium guajava]
MLIWVRTLHRPRTRVNLVDWGEGHPSQAWARVTLTNLGSISKNKGKDDGTSGLAILESKGRLLFDQDSRLEFLI